MVKYTKPLTYIVSGFLFCTNILRIISELIPTPSFPASRPKRILTLSCHSGRSRGILGSSRRRSCHLVTVVSTKVDKKGTSPCLPPRRRSCHLVTVVSTKVDKKGTSPLSTFYNVSTDHSGRFNNQSSCR